MTNRPGMRLRIHRRSTAWIEFHVQHGQRLSHRRPIWPAVPDTRSEIERRRLGQNLPLQIAAA